MNPGASLGGVTCGYLFETFISKLRDEVWSAVPLTEHEDAVGWGLSKQREQRTSEKVAELLSTFTV